MSEKPIAVRNYFIVYSCNNYLGVFIYVRHHRAQLRNITLYVILAELLNQR